MDETIYGIQERIPGPEWKYRLVIVSKKTFLKTWRKGKKKNG